MSLSSNPSGPAAAPAGSAPDAEACRAQLRRIVTSPGFDASDRDRRFLSFVVEEALAGRADRIKAYAIAVEVFGRDPSFDPQSDPIVRVEAGHLRRAIDRYYLGEGRADPVEITIPKGGYVPRFVWRAPSGDPGPAAGPAAGPAPAALETPAATPVRPAAPRRWLGGGLRGLAVAAGLAAGVAVLAGVALFRAPEPARPGAPDLPRLLVEPFADLTPSPDSAAIAQGLTLEVVSRISKFRDIVVVAGGDRGAAPEAAADLAPRYALSGSVDLDDGHLRLQALLTDRSGAVVWADTYTDALSVGRVMEIEQDIARKVATALAQPYGVIFRADAARPVPDAPEDWAAYACTLSYYAYRQSLDAPAHAKVRRCLEQAVERFPDYATAWGLLAQTYIDEVRFRFPADPAETEPPVTRALAAARRAVDLDPANVRGLQAEMFALTFAGEFDAALEIGAQAMAINPNDTELMGEYGYRLALSGRWDEGCALVEEARTRNPVALVYYESALALCAYTRGDLDAAQMWIRKADVPDNPQYHVIAALIHGEAGDPAEVAWIRQNAPHVYADPRSEIALRVRRPEDVDRFLASLRKAGLPVPGQD